MSDFMFNASALGLGGKFTHADGSTSVISSRASVALPPTSGEGSSIEENYSNPRLGVSFARAESRVSGVESGNKGYEQFTTYADVCVTGLTVLKRFKVAFMFVSMTSTRGLDPKDSQFELKALYRGVSFDDEEIIPAIDFDLCKVGDYNDFTSTLSGNLRQYAAQLNVKEPELSEALANRQQPILGSIVKRVDSKNKTLVCLSGNKLMLPIGSVRFGELLVKPGRRRVNLLRFNFGGEENSHHFVPALKKIITHAASSIHVMDDEEGVAPTAPVSTGSMTAGSLDGNGVPVWPHS